MGVALCKDSRSVPVTLDFAIPGYEDSESEELRVLGQAKSVPANLFEVSDDSLTTEDRDMYMPRARRFKSVPNVSARKPVDLSNGTSERSQRRALSVAHKSTPNLRLRRLENPINISEHGQTHDPRCRPLLRSTRSGNLHSRTSILSNVLNHSTPRNFRKKLSLRSRTFSLTDLMKDHQRESEATIVGEREAKLYAEMVEKDTIDHVENAVRIASLVATQSEHIGEELERQGGVIRQARNDIHNTDQDINDSNNALKGMKSVQGKVAMSLRGKVANKMRRKKPKFQLNDDFQSGELLSEPAPVTAAHFDSPAVTNQQKIKRGITELNLVFDKINHNQLAIAEEIQRQDMSLTKLSGNLCRTDKKLKAQTDLISSIYKGS